MGASEKPITVLISSRNRPIYLWACLDALWRYTSFPHRFILVDMASDDVLVPQVIRGFERRGMFAEVIRAERNDPAVLTRLVMHELDRWAPYFAYVESDVVVEETSPCWVERMASLMDAHPRLAMLGSTIDRRDFIDPESVDHLRRSETDKHWRALMKADSPERRQDPTQAVGKALFRPHSPPGRLLVLRTDAIKQVGLATDTVLDKTLRAAGYQTAIATGVRHRHLSLVQLFDYPEYDLQGRDKYMEPGQRFPPAPPI